MFCQRCGVQLPENKIKCPNCGAEYTEENSDAQITVEKEAPQKSFFTKKKIIITLITTFILIAAGITAAVILSKGSSISVNTADMLQLADKYLREMNYEQAIIEFSMVLEIEPKNTDAYLGLAEAYVALGNNERAIAVLEQAKDNVDNQQTIEEKLTEVKNFYESEHAEIITNTEPNSTAPLITTTQIVTATVTTAPIPETTVPITTTAAETTVQITSVTVETAEQTISSATEATEQTASATTETTDESDNIPSNNTQTFFIAEKGDALQLTVDTSELVEWSSLNPYVAQVDQTGIVTVQHRGRAKIKAKFGEETRIFTVDSLSENLRNTINRAVVNGEFGTINEVISYSDKYDGGAGDLEIIERDDYDDYHMVASYIYASENIYDPYVFSYNYVYLENENIGEESYIITDGSKFNGLTFYNCKTAFYEDTYYDRAIVSFNTIGKVTFEAELAYHEESDPNNPGDEFYILIDRSSYLSALPFAKDYYAEEYIINLNMTDTLKNELKQQLNNSDSLGICRLTIENFESNWYPIWGEEQADLKEVQFSNGSIYKDVP
ncbi:MAG: tetratricopeptide repeat protein [Eubacterium sp.]|nr:tetratricopeptide repeat protein [Eubacterium sp.]